jgi:predicted SprT family Zn-dependent metalloprotease
MRRIQRRSGMRQRLQISLSLACLAVIFWGAGYARGRERFRQTDLHAVYQQVNRDSFGSNLPDVSVKWAELPDDYGVAIFYPDGTVEIEIDRESVTSEEQLLETMRHESCHVMTHAVVEETRQDWHGEAFQACMKRFE